MGMHALVFATFFGLMPVLLALGVMIDRRQMRREVESWAATEGFELLEADVP